MGLVSAYRSRGCCTTRWRPPRVGCYVSICQPQCCMLKAARLAAEGFMVVIVHHSWRGFSMACPAKGTAGSSSIVAWPQPSWTPVLLRTGTAGCGWARAAIDLSAAAALLVSFVQTGTLLGVFVWGCFGATTKQQLICCCRGACQCSASRWCHSRAHAGFRAGAAVIYVCIHTAGCAQRHARHAPACILRRQCTQ